MKHHTSKRLYILYVITKLELGGAQKICLNLYQGMHENGISAGIMTGAEGELVHALAESHQHTFFVKSLKREVCFLGMWDEIVAFVAMVKTMRALRRQYPHIIVHTHSTKAGLMGRWAAFFAGIKRRVHTVHGYGFHAHQFFLVRFFIYLAELVTSLITTHYVCVSSADAKRGISIFPGFARKHSIIRAAVDWSRFYAPARAARAFPVAGEPFVFGTVACFKPQKNIFDLLRAFCQVHERCDNTRLEIIGDGVLRADIQAWVHAHGLTPSVLLHGWQHDVIPIMLGWHAFVLSSLWEGLPCAVVEARLLKMPVLSYDTGGIHDVITSGENGLLFKQRDWLGLARGMEKLLSDQGLYGRLQNYADELSDFNDKNMREFHIDLYKSI